MPQKKAENNSKSAIDGFWKETAVGRGLFRQENDLVQSLASRFFGRFMLQMNGLGRSCTLQSFTGVRKQWVIGLAPGDPGDLCAVPEQLPVMTSSINVFYLSHVLEFSSDPRRLLREVERTLIPGGRLLITGFNPYGLFGLWSLFGRRYPWSGHFLGPRRLVDWLSLLGFEVEQVEYLGYTPPLTSQLLYDRCALLQRSGRRFWPVMSSAYLVLAVKREVPMNLLRPNWEKKRGFVPQGGLEPTTRSDHGG